jgi:hypothetical protein
MAQRQPMLRDWDGRSGHPRHQHAGNRDAPQTEEEERAYADAILNFENQSRYAGQAEEDGSGGSGRSAWDYGWTGLFILFLLLGVAGFGISLAALLQDSGHESCICGLSSSDDAPCCADFANDPFHALVYFDASFPHTFFVRQFKSLTDMIRLSISTAPDQTVNLHWEPVVAKVAAGFNNSLGIFGIGLQEVQAWDFVTFLDFNITLIDTHGIVNVSGSSFEIPRNGTYQISGSVMWIDNSTRDTDTDPDSNNTGIVSCQVFVLRGGDLLDMSGIGSAVFGERPVFFYPFRKREAEIGGDEEKRETETESLELRKGSVAPRDLDKYKETIQERGFPSIPAQYLNRITTTCETIMELQVDDRVLINLGYITNYGPDLAYVVGAMLPPSTWVPFPDIMYGTTVEIYQIE